MMYGITSCGIVLTSIPWILDMNANNTGSSHIQHFLVSHHEELRLITIWLSDVSGLV